MIEILILLPWITSFFGHVPLTYLQGVGMWSGMAGFLIGLFAFVAMMEDHELKWLFLGLTAYYWFLYWIFV